MQRIYLPVCFALFLCMPLHSFADEVISFKGIKFGMNADEIAKLGGGNTKYGCLGAIQSKLLFSLYGGNQPWTYGGIDTWSAWCMESFDEAHRVPGVSGLIEITTSKNNESNTYSVEEFVEIFTPVFGEFSIETKATSNPLGKDVIKKDASAIHGGAKMQITDVVSDENKNYIVLKIESLDYLNKKNAFEMESASDKIKSAKSDF